MRQEQKAEIKEQIEVVGILLYILSLVHGKSVASRNVDRKIQ